MRLTSFAVGSLIFVAGTFGYFLLEGGAPRVLYFPGSLLAELLIPLGSGVVAFGFPDVLRTCGAIRVLWTDEPAGIDCARIRAVVSSLIVSAYLGSAVVFLLNLMSIMPTLSQVAAHGLNEDFGRAVARTISSLAYPLLIAEGLLRPMKQRLGPVPGTN